MSTTISARRLLLNLLLASGGEPLAARVVVSACGLFDISENNARVTLARLVSDGLLESVERAEYRLGPAGAELALEVSAWRDVERRLRKWRGGWLAVHGARGAGRARGSRGSVGGGSSVRAQQARRERALSITGFKQIQRGLLIRPDNLVGGVARVRERLSRLGLGPEAMVFSLTDLDPVREAQALQLWDAPTVEREYAATRSRLSAWLRGAKALPIEERAKQAFLLGDGAIRQVVFDPLLPEPLVSAQARSAFLEDVLSFDAAGRAIWEELYRMVKSRAAPGGRLHP